MTAAPDDAAPPRRTRRPRLVAVLPTLLTLGNAACGFAAVTVAAKVEAVGLGEVPASAADAAAGTHLFVAAVLIFAAMIFDAFDGSAARLLGQNSELGAQLDSLCDAVSFGVAPAFLMLQLVNHPFEGQDALAFRWPGRVVWGAAVLFVLCAILRLARFNVETDEEDDHSTFRGLPSPAAAATVASVPLVMRGLLQLQEQARGWDVAAGWTDDLAAWLIALVRIALPVVTLAAAGLMVSPVLYPHVVNRAVRGREKPWFVVKVLFAGVAAVVFREFAVPLVAFWFAFSHPLRTLLRREPAARPATPAG